MYIIKNAFKSISRSMGRNILIGIIVFVIAVSSCISLSIKSAANKAEEQGIDVLTVTASISVNQEKRQAAMEEARSSGKDMREIMSSFTNISDLTLAELLKYAESKHVKDFNYTLTSSVGKSEGFDPYTTEEETETETNDNQQQPQRPGGMTGGGMAGGGGFFVSMGAVGDFNITGYSSENAMTQFASSTPTHSIVDGSMFDTAADDYSCIISEQLAAYNNLSVGDKVTITNPNAEEETYELTITGLYRSTESDSTSGGMMRMAAFMDPANQIYASYATLRDIADKSVENEVISTNEQTGMESSSALRTQESGTYVLADTDSFEAFKNDAAALGLTDDYSVISNDLTNYEESIKPLKNLSTFATTLFLIVLLVGSVILIVFNTFNIRERKYEVGVLTAIGMKKPKVALQFVTELFAVTFIALTLGTAVGAAASVPIGSKMLASQTESLQNREDQVEQSFGRPGQGGQGTRPGGGMTMINGGPISISNFGPTQAVEYIDSIQASVDLLVLGQIILLGFALTVVSSLAAVAFVLRYEPLKILSDRA